MSTIEKKASSKQKPGNSVKTLKKKTAMRKKQVKTNKPIDVENEVNDEAEVLSDSEIKIASKSSVVKAVEGVPKLYIRFKKTIKALSKTQQDLVAMHPLIKSVRLPRKKDNSKFFFAVFGSEAKALKAVKDLKDRKDCYVRAAFKVGGQANMKESKDYVRLSSNVDDNQSTEQVTSKKNLRYFWK